jgi:hypothetical protein
MSLAAVYYKGAELPDLHLTWEDEDGGVINFAAGWTFSVKVAREGSTTAAFSKSSGITGSASAPNVVIAWATSGELSTLAPGRYIVQVVATRSSDSKDRYFQGPLEIRSSIT